MIRNTHPAFRERTENLVKAMDFGFFYVPYVPLETANHPGLIRDPFRVDEKTFGGFNLLLNSELRMAAYIGIAHGHIPPEHYYRVRRTILPGELKQSQVPAGESRTYLGIPVFEGHYTYRGLRFVPTWGGSMFEALMVTLFVPEERWAPRSWGVNHPLYVRGQIEHGLKEARYGYWGFSPATNPEGDYRTYGVDGLASDPVGYTSNNDDIHANPADSARPKIFTNGIVTPHASFLALRYATREALENLHNLEANFPIYGEYGFMDSVNVSRGVVSDRVLALDQGMIMAAIANALADDAMRHAFSDGPIETILRPLIAPEEFTAGQASPGVDRVPHGVNEKPSSR
jgi:Putative glucoamylase